MEERSPRRIIAGRRAGEGVSDGVSPGIIGQRRRDEPVRDELPPRCQLRVIDGAGKLARPLLPVKPAQRTQGPVEGHDHLVVSEVSAVSDELPERAGRVRPAVECVGEEQGEHEFVVDQGWGLVGPVPPVFEAPRFDLFGDPRRHHDLVRSVEVLVRSDALEEIQFGHGPLECQVLHWEAIYCALDATFARMEELMRFSIHRRVYGLLSSFRGCLAAWPRALPASFPGS